MKVDMLTLLPGVQMAERGGQLEVTLAGRTRITSDTRQIALLRALGAGPRSVADLTGLLGASGAAEHDAFSALDLAAFILDFKDFLES